MTVDDDARRVPTGTTLEPDVCVVGAGPAGITLALSLARAGMRVVLLESGGRRYERAVQRFSRGDSVGEPYVPLHRARVRGFGGTSLHWVEFGRFRAAPLAPLDFAARSGIPHSGWPIDRTDLDPHYEQAMRWCGLGPWDFSVKRWATDDRPALPFRPRTATTVVFQLADVRTWSRRYDEVRATPNLQLLLHAHVTAIRLGREGDHVTSLEVRTPTGTSFEVRPRTTVLAAGGIENARLLLANRDRHADGIGNAHDLVGRFFQEHLMLRGGVIHSPDASLPGRLGLYAKHLHADGTRIHAKLAVDQEVVAERGLLNCVFFVERVSAVRAHPTTRALSLLRRAAWRPVPEGLDRRVAQAMLSGPRAARAAVRRMADRRTATPPWRSTEFQLLSEAEQAPNPDSRVTLHPQRRDAFGVPQVRLDWRLTEMDHISIARSHQLIDDALRRAGIGRLRGRVPVPAPSGMIGGHGHHMGTTRMHDDPRHGVVDRDCRVHGVQNLYVAGSSVFPTSGYANPTLTVVALALRLAEHLTSGR